MLKSSEILFQDKPPHGGETSGQKKSKLSKSGQETMGKKVQNKAKRSQWVQGGIFTAGNTQQNTAPNKCTILILSGSHGSFKTAIEQVQQLQKTEAKNMLSDDSTRTKK